jgi:hypothetical protein
MQTAIRALRQQVIRPFLLPLERCVAQTRFRGVAVVGLVRLAARPGQPVQTSLGLTGYSLRELLALAASVWLALLEAAQPTVMGLVGLAVVEG